jgi:DNA replication and repair protein RecF
MAARAARLGAARPGLEERYRALGGTDALELAYEPDLRRLRPELLEAAAGGDAGGMEGLGAYYRQALEETFEEGRRQGTCPTGVHRDDFAARLGGQDLRRFGSQGQHRLAALSLKLETAAWIERARGEPPLLLLDDFGSELDRGRRESVLEYLRSSMQVIVTATDREDLGPATLFERVARIDEGKLHGE